MWVTDSPLVCDILRLPVTRTRLDLVTHSTGEMLHILFPLLLIYELFSTKLIMHTRDFFFLWSAQLICGLVLSICLEQTKGIMNGQSRNLCLYSHSTEFPLGILDPPCRSERTILPAVWTSNGFTILVFRWKKSVGEAVIVLSQFLVMWPYSETENMKPSTFTTNSLQNLTPKSMVSFWSFSMYFWKRYFMFIYHLLKNKIVQVWGKKKVAVLK